MGLWSTVRRRVHRSEGRVVAHILDPIAGYSNRELRIGSDIAAETVRRMGDNGEVFIVVSYKSGVPSAIVRRRADWLRVQARQDDLDPVSDTSVWRAREELKIS
jgi:hypothetical protein